MAIFKVIKDGVEETIVQDSTQFSYKPDGKTKFYAVQRVKYKQDSWMPPTFINIGGKKYLMPKWVEVHSQAQLSDVIWEKPKLEVKQPEMVVREFTSKSNPDITYEARKVTLPTGKITFSCNCPGVWRSKTRECKHIKELKNA